jgi:hypothetical protein
MEENFEKHSKYSKQFECWKAGGYAGTENDLTYFTGR